MKEILSTLLLITLLTACGNSTISTSQAPSTSATNTIATESSSIKTTESFTLSKEQKETLTSFFKYFSEKNYEKMKDFCSKKYVKDFFHKDDVFGFKTAKLISYDESNVTIHDKEYWIPISLSGEPTKDSSNYDENSKIVEVGYDIILEQQTNGTWIITGITSG